MQWWQFRLMQWWQFRSTPMRSVILPKVSVLKIAWVHVLAASIGEGRGPKGIQLGRTRQENGVPCGCVHRSSAHFLSAMIMYPY
jgi:hypothetical protein